MWQVKKILPIFLFALILTIILLPFYRNGQIISGWEGAYFLDFPSLLTNRSYSWFDYGAGMVSYSLNFAFVFHLALLQTLIQNERVINFVMIFLLYFLPFTSMYLVARQAKLRLWLALLVGLFYITNPFTSHFMKSINQWNMLAAFIFPAFFWLIFRFYRRNVVLFLLFGVFSAFFAFTNANPPTMILYQIALVIFIAFVTLIKEEKFSFLVFVKKYLIVISSFILFNIWWIINWIYVFADAQRIYTTNYVLGWLNGSGSFIPAAWRTLTLTGLLENPLNHTYDYLNTHYAYLVSPILLSIPLVLIIIALFQKEILKKHLLFLFGIIFIVIFLAKGINPPLGKIYEFMVVHLPLFNIFKSAAEKWGILLVFLISLFVIFAVKAIKEKRIFLLMVTLLTTYVAYSIIPFIFGKFLPDYKHSDKVIGSKVFIDKAEYRRTRQKLNSDPLQYRVLNLPGGMNYQVALNIKGNRYYTGNDPVLNNINKTFLAPHNTPPSEQPLILFDNISHPNYLNIFPYFNIKKILINKDEYPWFGFRANESVSQIEGILNSSLESTKDGSIILYDMGNYFLPRIYTPTKIVKTDIPYGDFPGLLENQDLNVRSVFVPKDTFVGPNDNQPPNITFVKINPTKYKIKVENARSAYLLVFSENFHNGWKAYIREMKVKNGLYSNVVGRYFNNEIKEAKTNTVLFYGSALETLWRTPLPENRHLKVNWYANAWYIQPEDVGHLENYEIIIEYWPQRLFYLGTAISITTLTGSLVIVLKKLRNKK